MKTKHSDDCGRVFKNYDLNCPRCQELANGSPPRDGWQKGYYSRKAAEEAMYLQDIKTHDCQTSNCGIVCTAFEW